MTRTPEQRQQLVRDVAHAVNSNSAENESNTPDFLLAEFMVDALEGFESAIQKRATWYGKPLDEPAKSGQSTLATEG